ncbi:fumarate hydratase [Escherichia coli]
MKSLGTAACPPYHIAFVNRKTQPDQTLKIAKLAPINEILRQFAHQQKQQGQAFRDIELEKALLEASQQFGIGTRFCG